MKTVNKQLFEELLNDFHNLNKKNIQQAERIKELEAKYDRLDSFNVNTVLRCKELEAQITAYENCSKDHQEKCPDVKCWVQELRDRQMDEIEEQAKQIQELEAEKEQKCKWTYDDNYDMWETECGDAFCLTNGTPKTNKMKYCPYCGKLIEQALKGK